MANETLPTGHETPWVYGLSQMVVRGATPIISRLHTEGLENIPREGPVILALNHITWFDIPLASVRVPRVTHYMAKIELFETPLLGTFMRHLGAFQVKRGEGDRDALRIADKLLKEGKALVVFPEGHRSGGQLGPGHPGIAYIAMRSGAPIVPVAISGTERVLKGWRIGPWAPPVTVRYGKPFHLNVEGKGRRRDTLALAADQIMRQISALLPPEYRGVYADLNSTVPVAGTSSADAAETASESQVSESQVNATPAQS